MVLFIPPGVVGPSFEDEAPDSDVFGTAEPPIRTGVVEPLED